MGDEESRIDRAGDRGADARRHRRARARRRPTRCSMPAARATYDAALCMYHDQALIPIKTIDFSGGVNVTLGLPFVRTSPDHGTALDIAGTGRADPASLIAALAHGRRHGRAGAGDLSRWTWRPLPPLRETIAAHGLDARKRLGQHFLLDLNLTRRIARAAGTARPRHGDRGRPRSGRPDARAAARGRRAGRRDRGRSARPRRPRTSSQAAPADGCRSSRPTR